MYLHFGGEHYDPVVQEVINAPDQLMQSIPNSQKEKAKGGGCGRDESNKKSQPEERSEKKFCFKEPGERQTLWPSYRAYKPCSELCRCFNFGNTIGKRPESGPQKS